MGIYTTMNRKLYPAGEELPMMDILEILFTAFGNNQESAKKSDHIAKEWAKRRKVARANKLALTKLTPPWIVVRDDRTMIEDKDRAALVLRWFELAAAGNGAKAIGSILDGEGIETWERFDRKARIWNRTFIAATLRNREVLGEFQPMRVQREEDGTERRVPEGDVWTNHFPAIVPADLFARVNREAPDRKEAARGMKSEKLVNLFSGLLHCHACGSTLEYRRGRAAGDYTTKGGRHYSYKRDNVSLICPVGASRNSACDNRRYLAYLTFEDAILNSCLHLALDDNAFSNRGEVSRLNITIAQKEHSRDLSNQRAVNLWSAYAESPSRMAMQLAQRAEADGAELNDSIEALMRQREEAHGRADSAAHLKRVAAIRDNLYHPDLSVRVPLRKKVAQSVRSLLSHGNYDGDGVTIYFKAALALMRVDRKGRVDALDLTTEADEIAHPDFVRRRKAALEESGNIFGAVAA